MKILHVLSQTEMTGAEVYAQNLIQHQIDQGHEVSVVSEKIHVSLPVAWISLPLGSGHRLRRWISIFKLRKIIAEKQIEIIHCHSRGAVRHAAWARVGTKAAMITTLHGRQHSSFSKKLINLYGELLVAVCENVKKSTARDFKIHPDQIEVIGNPMAIPADSIFQSNRSSNKNFRLALIGRSTGPKGKRFEEIGDSYFQAWLKSYPHLEISLVVPNLNGFSPTFQAMLQILQKEFESRFQVLSHVENLAGILPSFDLVVGSGRVAIETLLAKTPLLALGEYCSHGLISSDNIIEAKETNFGDMGDLDLERKFFPQEVDKILQDLIQNKNLKEISPEKNTEKTSIKALEGISSPEQLARWITAFFSASTVNEQIIKVYQRALFKRKHPRWIPALMYHKIPEAEIDSPHRIFVTKENFEKHLQFFKSHKFETIHFKELYEYIFLNNCQSFSKGRNFPQKPLLLTFDDGYLDNLTNAEPLLKKYQMKAHIYLLANADFKENTWDTRSGDVGSPIMSKEERKKLDLSVWEIGSHGLHHAKLPEVDDSTLELEINQSKKLLENEFSTSIFSFAYPFGLRNEKVEAPTRQAYHFAVNTDQGALHLADNPWSIFRVNIFPEDTSIQLRKKCSLYYRKYFFKKRGR